MKDEVMKEALKKRRGMGLDLTIIVGKPEAESKNPDKQELAPEVEDAHPSMQQVDSQDMDVLNTEKAQHPDEEQDVELIKKMLGDDINGKDETTSLLGKARALMRAKLKK